MTIGCGGSEIGNLTVMVCIRTIYTTLQARIRYSKSKGQDQVAFVER